MKIVDTRGQLCPAPLIETRRALREATGGESFKVLTDNKTSFSNISRFLKDNGIGFVVAEENGVWTLTITGNDKELSKPDVNEFCSPEIPHFNTGDFVIAIGSDRMGDGDRELGDLLMINFIKAVKDLDVLPSRMVFYNSGVLLGRDESPASAHLKELEQMGVSLFLCGTCINHYKAADDIHTGTVSNMFEIARIMATSGKVIKP